MLLNIIHDGRSIALFFFILLGFALVPESVSAQPSHLSQPITEHVTLVRGYLSGAKGCGLLRAPLQRLSPGGQVASSEFVVPKEKILVITDVEWRVIIGNPKGGESMQLTAYPEGSGYQSFRSSIAVIASEQAYLGIGLAMLGASDQLTAGFQIGGGKRVCLSYSSPTGTFDPDGPAADPQITLRGYLTDAVPDATRRRSDEP